MLDNIEIEQLLTVAKLYLKLSKSAKNKLNNKLLNTPIKKLTNQEKSNSNLIKYSAHLGSCAIRLFTIDDKLKNESNDPKSMVNSLSCIRINCYNDMKQDEDYIKYTKNDIISNNLLHIVFRHNIAHLEEDKKIGSNPAKEHFQNIFIEFSHKELNTNLNIIYDSIRKDLKKIKLI